MVRRKCASAQVANKVRPSANAVDNYLADFHLNLTTSAGWAEFGCFRWSVHGIYSGIYLFGTS